MGVSHYNEQIRRIVLSGEIREETAAVFLEQMTALERTDMEAPIAIYIDTYGGNVRSALAMYDMMRICACPIETIGIGKVMSAGVLLLAAGDKGRRYLTSSCGVMIHQISGGVFGTVAEMETNIKETQYLQELYIDILSKHSGAPKTKIKKDMQLDNYMTAKQAIQYGVADFVLPSRKNILIKGKK
jgi:ATP-dependent Clp protease protease subunit